MFEKALNHSNEIIKQHCCTIKLHVSVYFICTFPVLPSDECNIKARPYFYSTETSSCIYVENTKLNWYKAREKCIEREGDLVTIDSIEKNAFILTSLGTGTLKPTNVWVGLTATRWTWNSGKPSYSMFVCLNGCFMPYLWSSSLQWCY